MAQHYSNPKRANDPHALPDIEVFYGSPTMELTNGWYWWPCMPGCLPDGEPCGPFDTEQEALDDARDGIMDDDDAGDDEQTAAIPPSHPVQPLGPNDPAKDRATCGTLRPVMG